MLVMCQIHGSDLLARSVSHKYKITFLGFPLETEETKITSQDLDTKRIKEDLACLVSPFTFITYIYSNGWT